MSQNEETRAQLASQKQRIEQGNFNTSTGNTKEQTRMEPAQIDHQADSEWAKLHSRHARERAELDTRHLEEVTALEKKQEAEFDRIKKPNRNSRIQSDQQDAQNAPITSPNLATPANIRCGPPEPKSSTPIHTSGHNASFVSRQSSRAIDFGDNNIDKSLRSSAHSGPSNFRREFARDQMPSSETRQRTYDDLSGSLQDSSKVRDDAKGSESTTPHNPHPASTLLELPSPALRRDGNLSWPTSPTPALAMGMERHVSTPLTTPSSTPRRLWATPSVSEIFVHSSPSKYPNKRPRTRSASAATSVPSKPVSREKRHSVSRSASMSTTARRSRVRPESVNLEEDYVEPGAKKEKSTREAQRSLRHQDQDARLPLYEINFLSYTPGDDSGFSTTWRQNVHLQMTESLTYEPRDGIKKLGSKGPMVLDDKWNGNAFFDHNSGRFEVCRKTGERLRIQFKTRELVRFMTTFEGVCNTLNTAKVTTSALGQDDQFLVEASDSDPAHLS